MSKTNTKTRTRTNQGKTELPTALYAAAGAGELAFQQLRKLPEVTARTLRSAGETADTLRQRFANGDRDLTADLTQVRTQFRESARRGADSARRGAEALAARAQDAQEKAVTRYRSLVAHGERVVSERFGVATGHADSPTRVQAVVGDPEEDKVTPAPAVAAGPAAKPTTPAAKPATPGSPVASGSAGRTTPAGRGTTGTGTGTGAGTGTQNTRGVAKTGARTAGKRAA